MSRTEGQTGDSGPDGVDHEVPPSPEAVLDDNRVEYQALTELDGDEYARLAADIRDRGVLQPIIVDEDDTILDGHHRAAIAEHYDLDASRQPDYVVIGDLDGDNKKLARAIKQNLSGRDTTDAVKSAAVEQYIETAWDRTDDGALIRPETDTQVADDLGVDRSTVTRVLDSVNAHIIKHARLKAQRYYEANPDASYREVARQVDKDHTTVTDWLKEDFDEGDDGDDEDNDQTVLQATTTPDERNKAQETFKKARDTDSGDGEADNTDEVTETAEANAERLAEGKTSPQTASKNVEMAEAEKAVEEDRSADDDERTAPTVVEADAHDWLTTAPTADVLVTDPPFTTDVDDIESFAESWVPQALDTVADDGYAYIFIGSYADELAAYLSVLAGTEYYVQPLVWNYRNTLGRSPDARYKRDWQAVLYCRGPDAGDLDAPKTSELRAVQRVNSPGMIGDDAERHHKWQKPSELLEAYISHATDKGDTVVDPFAGSGEVLLTAAETGRVAHGCDIDPDAVATAVSRGCVRDE